MTAARIFHMNGDNRLTHVRMEMDKLSLWHQLGWCSLGPEALI